MLRITGMSKKLVTCPETGHLEEIELAHTTSGIVILRCSRFSPPCALDCPRECARRMDRRERAALLIEATERVLVVVAGGDPGTRAAAAALAGLLHDDGLTVDVADVAAALPPPQDYDAIVIGCGQRYGSGVRALLAYVDANRELSAMPAFFFGTRPAAATATSTRIARATGWRPTAVATIDGTHDDDLRRLAVWVADELPMTGSRTA